MNNLKQLIEDCRSVGIEIPEKLSESDYEVLFAIQAIVFLQIGRIQPPTTNNFSMVNARTLEIT
jgi:hypothetical protein